MEERKFRFSEVRAIRKNYWFAVITVLFGVLVFSQFFFFKSEDHIRWVIIMVSFMLLFVGGMSYTTVRNLMHGGISYSSEGLRVFSTKKNFTSTWDEVEKISIKPWIEKGMIPASQGGKTTTMGKHVHITTKAGNFSFGVLEGQPKESGYNKLEDFLDELLACAPKEKIEILKKNAHSDAEKEEEKSPSEDAKEEAQKKP